MSWHRHLDIGFCLSFHPANAKRVATYPTDKHSPNSRSRAAATGRQITIFTHSYKPSMVGVLLRNGSIVLDPGTSNPSCAPINANGLWRFSSSDWNRAWGFLSNKDVDWGWSGWSSTVRMTWGWCSEERKGVEREWSSAAIAEDGK